MSRTTAVLIVAAAVVLVFLVTKKPCNCQGH